MKLQRILKDYLAITIGTFLLVVAVRYFVLPFNILSGGVAGIAVVLSPVLNIGKDIIANSLVVILFIVGGIFLGRKFIFKTIASSLMYPLFLSILMNYPIEINIDPFLASAYAGVLSGLGVGMVFRVGASTGGVDVPVLVINKFTHLPIPNLVLTIDVVTVLAGYLVFGIEPVLIGLISAYACSLVIDKVLLFGTNKAISVNIISEHYLEISKMIHDELDRGSTVLSAYGGYTNKERPVLLCAIDAKEYPDLIRKISDIDKEAFIISNQANEVRGNGFFGEYRV